MRSELAELAAGLLDHLEAQRLLGADLYLPAPGPPRAASLDLATGNASGRRQPATGQRLDATVASRAPALPAAPAEQRFAGVAATRARPGSSAPEDQRFAAGSAARPQAPPPDSAGQRFADRLAAPQPPEIQLAPARSVPQAARGGSPVEALRVLSVEAGACTRCRLHQTRTKVVFGVGAPDAKLVFVGEAPGHNEDLSGEPFVGEAGKLLDKIIVAMGLTRAQVYICNIIKCRPPSNRQPRPDEIEQCEPYLIEQLGIVAPKVICALGTYAAQTLLRTTEPIGQIRGKFFRYHDIELMPTYHPAYLLRNTSAKRTVWEDMQKVQVALGIPPGSYADRGPFRD